MPPRRKKDDKKSKKDARRESIAPRVMVCSFCQSETIPDYKTPADLARFISDRGKILSRSRTGICAKHQRNFARSVKRARHLSLLPFSVRPQ
ncbi:MAG: 30S ribosomal protein S18 [Candidatus Blackburnbacteria bacterium]|nr:30S ribosomal protein S18 [Candidatus Blackburnbacteria bacterium]